MIRFRNPGTQYGTQVQVIKQLYDNLGTQESFTLQDMATVIAKGRLMTAYGYAGDNALELSSGKANDSESMNSALMNAKMYAEVFRMLGWVTPLGDRSYPLVFTYIGIHMALAQSEAIKKNLYEQCVLGINNPTELTNRMSYDEKVRFFRCALRSIIDLGGTIYKHELCLGPMSVNDEDEIAYQRMIAYIKRIRGDFATLDTEFKKLADSLGMKPTPVDNCTRLPIAFMKACDFVRSVRNDSLYNKSLSCLQITPHGREVYAKIKDMCDIRLDSYNACSYKERQALIRLGVYSMLLRSGYDMGDVKDQIDEDRITCENILKGRELLFSPCQTIKRSAIETALKINLTKGKKTSFSNQVPTTKSIVLNSTHSFTVSKFSLDKNTTAAVDLLIEPEDEEFLQQTYLLKKKGMNSRKIVEYLFEYYKKSTQTTFYPLISTLFKIMGYDCSFSRPGDNGSRWDAIIVDKERSIPIEIKSPTEVSVLSIKAIRQALENKIILLSRETYTTQITTTSLAVGYAMPGDRTDINDLIAYIKETYGYRIGIIDFKTLLTVAISILVDGKGFDKEKLYDLEGLMYASF